MCVAVLYVYVSGCCIRNGSRAGGSGPRGGGKGRGSSATLPYVLPCTADTGQTSDSSDGNSDDKRVGEGGKVRLPKVCCTSLV